MTWKEIKDSIESQGVKDETEIKWIDFRHEAIVSFAEDGTAEVG